jgi:hypothetical protein
MDWLNNYDRMMEYICLREKMRRLVEIRWRGIAFFTLKTNPRYFVNKRRLFKVASYEVIIEEQTCFTAS